LMDDNSSRRQGEIETTQNGIQRHNKLHQLFEIPNRSI